MINDVSVVTVARTVSKELHIKTGNGVEVNSPFTHSDKNGVSKPSKWNLA